MGSTGHDLLHLPIEIVDEAPHDGSVNPFGLVDHPVNSGLRAKTS